MRYKRCAWQLFRRLESVAVRRIQEAWRRRKAPEPAVEPPCRVQILILEPPEATAAVQLDLQEPTVAEEAKAAVCELFGVMWRLQRCRRRRSLPCRSCGCACKRLDTSFGDVLKGRVQGQRLWRQAEVPPTALLRAVDCIEPV